MSVRLLAWVVVATGVAGCEDAPVAYDLGDPEILSDCEPLIDPTCAPLGAVDAVDLGEGRVAVLFSSGYLQTLQWDGARMHRADAVAVGDDTGTDGRLLPCRTVDGVDTLVVSRRDRLYRATSVDIEPTGFTPAADLDMIELAGARCLSTPNRSWLLGVAQTSLVWAGRLGAPGWPLELNQQVAEAEFFFSRFDAAHIGTSDDALVALLVSSQVTASQVEVSVVELREDDGPTVMGRAVLDVPRGGVGDVYAMPGPGGTPGLAVAAITEDEAWTLHFAAAPEVDESWQWSELPLGGRVRNVRRVDLEGDGGAELVVTGSGGDGVFIVRSDGTGIEVVRSFDLDVQLALPVDFDGGPLEILALSPHEAQPHVEWNTL